MKYRCLILDHDDTVVKSTPQIHYPAFVEILKTLRPERKAPTLAEFMEYCSEPGYFTYCRDVVGLTEQEDEAQNAIWYRYVDAHIPQVYEGFPALLEKFVQSGGTVCVCTHSESRIVLRDYRENHLPAPALVFGAELGEEKRKPNPYPIEEIERRLGFAPGEMVMVDDLMTGLAMARRCGVLAVAAGWSHLSQKVRSRVESSCDVYCSSVSDLAKLLFAE